MEPQGLEGATGNASGLFGLLVASKSMICRSSSYTSSYYSHFVYTHFFAKGNLRNVEEQILLICMATYLFPRQSLLRNWN